MDHRHASRSTRLFVGSALTILALVSSVQVAMAGPIPRQCNFFYLGVNAPSGPNPPPPPEYPGEEVVDCGLALESEAVNSVPESQQLVPAFSTPYPFYYMGIEQTSADAELSAGSAVAALVKGTTKVQLSPLCKRTDCASSVQVGSVPLPTVAAPDLYQAEGGSGSSYYMSNSLVMDMQQRGHGDEIRGKYQWYVYSETSDALKMHRGIETDFEYLMVKNYSDIMAAANKELHVVGQAIEPTFEGSTLQDRQPSGSGGQEGNKSVSLVVGYEHDGVKAALGGSWTPYSDRWKVESDGSTYHNEISKYWGACYLGLQSNGIWRVPMNINWNFRLVTTWAVSKGGC